MPTTFTISEINSFKTALKKELARRANPLAGSVSKYSAASYDFSEVPASGVIIKTEHGQKTIDLLLQIKDVTNTTAAVTGQPIPPAQSQLKLVSKGNIIPSGFNYTNMYTNTLAKLIAESW